MDCRGSSPDAAVFPGKIVPPGPGISLISPLYANPTQKSKDGLIRLLLQNAVPNPSAVVSSSSSRVEPLTPVGGKSTPLVHPTTGGGVKTNCTGVAAMNVPTVTITDESQAQFLHQISYAELQAGSAALDHTYQRPLNFRPDGVQSTVTRTLFVPQVIRNAAAQKAANQRHLDGAIDVVTVDGGAPLPLPYGKEKAERLMAECELFCEFANPEAVKEEEMSEWEEKIVKDGWTSGQKSLFARVVQALHADRLAKLAVKGWDNEPLERRLIVDKTSKRLRKILASILWDKKAAQWLHNTLTNVLPEPYLAAYLDSLQTLRSKVDGSLVDKMVSTKVHKHQIVSNEGVRLLLKRPWDPSVYKTVHPPKLKRLSDAILILTPSHPRKTSAQSKTKIRKRAHVFHRMWRELFETVIEISPPNVVGKLPDAENPTASNNETEPPTDCGAERSSSSDVALASYLRKLLKTTLAKIKELRANRPKSPIVLAGWGAAAAINCQVATMTMNSKGNLVYHDPLDLSAVNRNVAACINLGFPFFTVDGCRGEPDDPILDANTPLLFIIGQNATQCRRDEMEDLREKIKAPTGLVVVGGADDRLRMSKKKKRLEGITQSMVDRCIVDEIRSFLVGVLSSPPPNFSYQNCAATSPAHFNMLGLSPNMFRAATVCGTTTGKRSSRPRKRNSNSASGGSQLKRSKHSPSGSGGSPLQLTPTSQLPPGMLNIAGSEQTGSGRKCNEGDPSRVRKVLDMNQFSQVPTMIPSNMRPPTLPIPTMATRPPLMQMPTAPIPPTCLQLSRVMLPPPSSVSAPRTAQQPLTNSCPLLSNAFSSLAAASNNARQHARSQFQTSSKPSGASTAVVTFASPPGLAKQQVPANMAAVFQHHQGGRIAGAPQIVRQQHHVRSPAATVVLPTVPHQQQQQPTQIRMVQSGVETTPSSSAMIRPTPRIVLGSCVTAAVPGSSQQPVVRVGGQPFAGTAAGFRRSLSAGALVRAPGMSGANEKDGLYIVTLPPDQVKRLEGNSGSVIQYHTMQGQMILVNDPSKGIVNQLVGTKPNVYFAQSPGLNVSKALTPPTAAAAFPPQTSSQNDRRNVAEILASLSGLRPVDPPLSIRTPGSSTSASRNVSPVPTTPTGGGSNLIIEPIPLDGVPAAKTTSAPTTVSHGGVTITALPTTTHNATAATKTITLTATTAGKVVSRPPTVILSSSSSSKNAAAPSSGIPRIVRVLQYPLETSTSEQMKTVTETAATTDCPATAKRDSTSTDSASSSAASSSSTTLPTSSTSGRSRKQVLDPSEFKTPLEEQEGNGRKLDDGGLTPVAMGGKVEYEQDILEEDLDDLEYVPYKKNKSGKKGGGGKSSAKK